MITFIEKIYKARYFWSHLAKMDMKIKFRYSKLGILWGVLQPIFLTLILAFVFGTVFGEELGEYSMYILSGTVVWNFLQCCMVGGAGSLIGSAAYIRQFNHPIMIYSLRTALFNIYSFILECIALVLWVLCVKPENLLIGFMSLPITIVTYVVVAWLLVTISGYLGTRYRDYTQIIVLVMQMVYFFSPVFFKEEIFKSNEMVFNVYYYNPITHILNFLRYPFVYGKMPATFDYLMVLIFIIVIGMYAAYLNHKHEKNIIFYL